MGILPDGDPAGFGLSDVEQLARNAIEYGLGIGGAIAVLFIIIGAYSYLTAFGDQNKAEQGKKTVTWALIGVAVIILAEVIVREVFGLISNTPPIFLIS